MSRPEFPTLGTYRLAHETVETDSRVRFCDYRYADSEVLKVGWVQDAFFINAREKAFINKIENNNALLKKRKH